MPERQPSTEPPRQAVLVRAGGASSGFQIGCFVDVGVKVVEAFLTSENSSSTCKVSFNSLVAFRNSRTARPRTWPGPAVFSTRTINATTAIRINSGMRCQTLDPQKCTPRARVLCPARTFARMTPRLYLLVSREAVRRGVGPEYEEIQFAGCLRWPRRFQRKRRCPEESARPVPLWRTSVLVEHELRRHPGLDLAETVA